MKRPPKNADRRSGPREPPSPPDRGEQYLVAASQADRWYRFFYPRKRYFESSVTFGSRVLRVHQGTLECTLGKGDLEPPGPLLLFDDGPMAGRVPAGPMEFVVVRAGHVASGTMSENLGESVRRAVQTVGADHVHLMTTCVPDLVGENPSRLGDELRRDFGVGFWWSPKTRPAEKPIASLVDELLGRVEFTDPRVAGRLVLAGIEEGRGADELRALVGQVDLAVDACVLPDIATICQMDRALRAGTLAWVQRAGWRWLRSNPFAVPLTVVEDVAPFGIEGSLHWLQRVAEAAGTAERFDRDRILEPWRARLQRVRERARGRKLALVGGKEDIAWLVSRTAWTGFSVARLACELGFDVVALAYAAVEHGESIPDVAAVSVESGSIAFGGFSTPAELHERLSAGISLAFSHFTFDPRLAALAIPAFSESVFEPGLAGAIRAAERMLRLVENAPFPGRLRRHATRGRP
jgi:hypothetical protein